MVLIAHDDTTGRLRLSKKQLERGLAAAILLEPWLGEHITIGWRYDARYGPWQPDPRRITILTDTLTGDRLLDSALALDGLGRGAEAADLRRQLTKAVSNPPDKDGSS